MERRGNRERDPAKDLLARSAMHVLLDDVFSHVGRIFVFGSLRFTVLGLLGCRCGFGFLGPGGRGIRKIHIGKAVGRWYRLFGSRCRRLRHLGHLGHKAGRHHAGLTNERHLLLHRQLLLHGQVLLHGELLLLLLLLLL
ncbi:MAG TPA: hypothetical protein DER64_16585, partial [Planctomycetaceae bacterium]|nr:hypothetical protein [Planctomycetaceae bacterium]